MEAKPGVELWQLDIKMRPVLVEAEKIWRGQGKGEGVTITCTGGGMHSSGSLHYYGLAVDLRTRYFGKEQSRLVGKRLREALGSDFDVVVHGTHIHVEYDPEET